MSFTFSQLDSSTLKLIGDKATGKPMSFNDHYCPRYTGFYRVVVSGVSVCSKYQSGGSRCTAPDNCCWPADTINRTFDCVYYNSCRTTNPIWLSLEGCVYRVTVGSWTCVLYYAPNEQAGFEYQLHIATTDECTFTIGIPFTQHMGGFRGFSASSPISNFYNDSGDCDLLPSPLHMDCFNSDDWDIVVVGYGGSATFTWIQT